MSKTATLNARIDPAVKSRAEKILSQVGVSASQAITMFYQQVIYRRGIPFDICIPNDLTVAALKESEAGGGQVYEGKTTDIFDAILAEDDNRGE